MSIGGFVPKPHTPFQWAPQCDDATVDARLRALREALRADRVYGRSIGFRYHDGKPSMVEGLLSRGDRRVAKVIRRVWEDGGRFDGWSETSPSSGGSAAPLRRWPTTAWTWPGTPPGSAATTRCCPGTTSTPGLDRDWLWQDWLAAIDPESAEVEDCRWTPCFECGVCPAMDTQIEAGPTGRRLLPLSVVGGDGAGSGNGARRARRSP